MISILVAIAAVSLVAISLFQIIYVSIYWLQTTLPDPSHGEPSTYAPKAAVVLCLRGDDPELIDCLEGIAWQSYPDFQLFCVFDSPEDPALQVLQENTYKFTNPPQTIIVDAVSFNRSLKCNSLLYAIEAIDSTYEVVAFIDSDTLPDSRWLSDLVKPLSDRQIGVTTGNRWFAPISHDFGSRLRQVWNSAAIVQMTLYGIAWGGSWAARREAILESNLRKHMQTAFCEDTALNRVFKGKTIHRVPQLVVMNSEMTDFRGAFTFIIRQLLTLRLYHRAWPLVFGHGLIILLTNAISLFTLAMLILSVEWPLTLLLAACIAFFQLFNILLLIAIEHRNKQILAYRDTSIRSTLEDSPLSFLLSVVAAQFVHPLAIIKAWLARSASWRGVEYQLKPESRVRMVKYQPYESKVGIRQSIE